MIKLSKAENRTLFENEHLRINSFLKEDLNEYYSFIDDVAVNSQSVYTKSIEKSGYLILIPLLNDIRLDMFGFKWKIEVNQIFVYYLKEGSEIRIDGVNGTEFSYFYSLFLDHEYAKVERTLLPVDLKRENLLMKVVKHDKFNVYLGKYELSKKGNLPLKRKERDWLVLSITGVFEVHDRLIESRDVLQLNTNEYIDYESLSTESLLMAIEY